jgi:hypothetical protein
MEVGRPSPHQPSQEETPLPHHPGAALRSRPVVEEILGHCMGGVEQIQRRAVVGPSVAESHGGGLVTHDEARTLGQAAVDRLTPRLYVNDAQGVALLGDIRLGLDLLHGMVVRLEEALRVSAEQTRVEMERRKAGEGNSQSPE